MTPVPNRIFSSVCIDILSMPVAPWSGQEYDSMVICVDRLSGWIVAKPTKKVGLTAEKAAHLMMDDGWSIYGVPPVITSDQGHNLQGHGGNVCAEGWALDKPLAKHIGPNPTAGLKWPASK